MDCLFYPEKARLYLLFRIDDAECLDALNAPYEKKRGYYSFEFLEPYSSKLFQLAAQIEAKPSKDRDRIESQLFKLAQDINTMDQLFHFLDFARLVIHQDLSKPLDMITKHTGDYRYSDLLNYFPQIAQLYQFLNQEKDKADDQAKLNIQEEIHLIEHVLEHIEKSSSAAQTLYLLPPFATGDPHWNSPGDYLTMGLQQGMIDQKSIDVLKNWENLLDALTTPDVFKERIKIFQQYIVELARERDQYHKIPLEVFFYKMNFFSYSLILFLFSFLLVASSWLKTSLYLNRSIVVVISTAEILLIMGIILRCVIRSRPPVSTLYETILFITSVGVFIALLMEYVNRERIAIIVAAVLGLAGMFIANRYELKDGLDTMGVLIAVLDTNFWLSTHVTSITIGYSGGLLAGALAHVFAFTKIFRLKVRPNFFDSLTRMVYGTICFTLFFSFLGTVLGGIWANESWGRFWGWDPKENGALLIFLWSTAVLHLRKGGYIRILGINMCAIFLAVIVSISWWGVNLLEVGLHSYGFTSGLAYKLFGFWAIEFAIIFFVFIQVWREKQVT